MNRNPYQGWAARPTLWQRFWRSPWTWLAWMGYWAWAITVHQSAAMAVLCWVFLIFSGFNFGKRANERWGKP